MKRFLLFALLILFVIVSSDDQDPLTYDVYDLDNIYLGYDNIKFYKQQNFTDGDKLIPITYYVFYSKRFLSDFTYDRNSSNKGLGKNNFENATTTSYSQDSDFEKDNYKRKDSHYRGKPDYSIQGMIVVDGYDNLIYFKSEEKLDDFEGQLRVIKIEWISKLQHYSVHIWDPNRPDNSKTTQYSLKTNKKLPLLSNFVSFFSLYLKKNRIKKLTNIEYINPFSFEMVKQVKTMGSYSSQKLDTVEILPPDGRTKFYPVRPDSFHTTVKVKDGKYILSKFNIIISLK